MMKQHCGMNLQHFVMVGINEDGELRTFSGPRDSLPAIPVKNFVDLEGYMNWFHSAGNIVPSKFTLPDRPWRKSWGWLTRAFYSTEPFSIRRQLLSWNPRPSWQLYVWRPPTI
jgi:hypothetical protein